MAIWYSFDPGYCEYTKHDTLKDALLACEKSIQEGLELNGWEWPLETCDTTIYRCPKMTEEPSTGVMTHRAKETILEYRPDDIDEDGYSESYGDIWPGDFEYISEWKMEAVETA